MGVDGSNDASELGSEVGYLVCFSLAGPGSEVGYTEGVLLGSSQVLQVCMGGGSS